MNRATRRGFALVMVLWGVALLSLLAAGLESAAMTARRESHDHLAAIAASALAEAGTNQAIGMLLDRRFAARPKVDGSAFALSFAGHAIAVSVQDEGGKVDINLADGPVLTRLLQGVGLSAEQASAMSDRIQDWRDPDDLKRENGAEADDYAAAGTEYRPGNAPFTRIEELKLVLGMTPELYGKLAGAVTVFSHRPTVNPVTATGAALATLEMPGGGQRSQPGDDATAAVAGIDATTIEAGGSYTIRASLTLDGTRLVRTTIVMLTDDPSRPILIEDIREERSASGSCRSFTPRSAC